MAPHRPMWVLILPNIQNQGFHSWNHTNYSRENTVLLVSQHYIRPQIAGSCSELVLLSNPSIQWTTSKPQYIFQSQSYKKWRQVNKFIRRCPLCYHGHFAETLHRSTNRPCYQTKNQGNKNGGKHLHLRNNNLKGYQNPLINSKKHVKDTEMNLLHRTW